MTLSITDHEIFHLYVQMWNIFFLIKSKKCKEFQVIKNGMKYSAIVQRMPT